jgi:hypothetical protein
VGKPVERYLGLAEGESEGGEGGEEESGEVPS